MAKIGDMIIQTQTLKPGMNKGFVPYGMDMRNGMNHNDHLGTPMLMTNSSGNIVWQGEFKPFGEPVSVSGSITNNLRFPGQYFDSETELNQNWHRDYKSEMGRYVEADPIGLDEEDVNLFAYVGNNTVNWIDPEGLYWLNNVSNFSAGFGNAITFGGTTWISNQINQAFGLDNPVNTCSGWYTGGKVAGYAWGAMFSGTTAARTFGWTSKIMPHGPHHTFGPLGKLSHIQTTIWRIGVKGSGRNIRIPLPWR